MPSPEPRTTGRARYAFGEFTLDLDEGFLRRHGEEIPLRPKPFEVLVYLVKHPDRLVTRRELIEAVWPDTAVMDNSLAQCVVELRRVLGDESQEVIRTVPRRGYVFTAPVTRPVVEFPQPVPLQAEPAAEPFVPRPSEPVAARSRFRYVIGGAVGVASVLVVAAAVWLQPGRVDAPRPSYTQLTNFTDSAVSPALSPDGRMLAFIRSDSWFLSPDQIYVKLLPDGEPIRVTNDARPKYAPVFTPDGSRIVYSVVGWSTYAVSALGGESTLFLANSSGVTWLDRRRILFSEVNPPSGLHMGIVTAHEDRSDQRAVYFPSDERGMVHLSYPSPDAKWAIALEMNPVWQPCRLVPLGGSSSIRQVGPTGRCTSAAWSPDGKWMYFGADVNGTHHLWRQRFPDGEPEPFTSGPTEEDGIAVTPDGRSLVTSIGMAQGALWIHDVRGDRPLSTQGYVSDPEVSGRLGSAPVFSRDGAVVYYLKSGSPNAPAELWRADLRADNSERVLPGTSMLEFDISNDGKEAVYSVQPPGKPSQIWVSALDRHSTPRLVADAGEDSPHFGRNGGIVVRSFDGTNHYLEQVDRGGSARTRIVPYPIGNMYFMSPDRQWITAVTAVDNLAGTYAVPLSGGRPQRICSGCVATWAPDGQFLYVSEQKPSGTAPGKARLFSLHAGEMLPVRSLHGQLELSAGKESRAYPDSRLIDFFGVSPGPDPTTYAYVKTTMHRNLFRIPVP